MRTAKRALLLLTLMLSYIRTDEAQAGLTLYEPGLKPILRGSGFQSFPLAVDGQGDVYTVTGTSPGDQLLEITTSGQVLTINNSVGGVIGTDAKLDFAFGGNLFATSYGGIIEYSLHTGASSMFYSNNSVSGDAGMVFDAARQILWVTNVNNDIVGLNASGQVVETIVPPSGGEYGLALDKSGNLVVINSVGLVDSINPTTQAITQLADLRSVLPNANIRSMAINPITGDLYFSNQFTGGNGSVGPLDGLYQLNPDGTGLKLFASGFTGQEAFGASSLGNGQSSMYLGDPNNYQLFEVQTVVPEPSSIMIIAPGALALLGLIGARRLRLRGPEPRKLFR